MKKLMILFVVLAIAMPAMAAPIVTIQVDPLDAKDHYEHSDIITIQLVGSGFGTDPWDSLGQIYVPTTGGIYQTGTTTGVASSPDMHEVLKEMSPHPTGVIVNSGGILIAGEIFGGSMSAGVPNGEAFYWFEFHVPDLPFSTEIEIYAQSLKINDLWGDDITFSYGDPLVIHIVPEPATMALLGFGGLFLRRRKKE